MYLEQQYDASGTAKAVEGVHKHSRGVPGYMAMALRTSIAVETPLVFSLKGFGYMCVRQANVCCEDLVCGLCNYLIIFWPHSFFLVARSSFRFCQKPIKLSMTQEQEGCKWIAEVEVKEGL